MTVEIGSLEEYTVEDMKVFRVDEYQWIAAPTLIHALVEFDGQDELEVEYLQDIEECDIDKNGMWDSENVTDQEKIDYADGKLTIGKASDAKFGDYGVFASELCKWTSFYDVIKRQGIGVYVIACTEY